MEFLILLVEKRGELVCREEAARRLWGTEVFVDVDHGINTAVRKIRMVLRDDPNKPRFVETVIGKGYRFAAKITCSGNTPEVPPSVEQPTIPSAPAAANWLRVLADKQVVSPKIKLLAVATFLLALATTTWLLSRTRFAPGHARPVIQSLAVLPLTNLSGDPGQEYLADGITEELIGRLSKIHSLRIISRTSVMRFKNTQLSAPEISTMLGADALVEGSVIREGNHIRVHAQLIRGASDEHFWSESYDRELPNLLALQSDVAQAIAGKVEATITGKEQERLAAAHRVSPEGYEAYLKGEFALQNMGNSRAGLEESLRYFEESVKLDPAFAPAYVGLAATHSQLSLIMTAGLPPQVERPKVESAAHKALQLDPNLDEAYVLLADVAQKQWRWAEAEAEYRRALEMNPNGSSAYAGLALWYLAQSRTEEALEFSQRARELDRFGFTNWSTAWILFHARRYDDAIHELRRMLAVRQDDFTLLWMLGFVLATKGQTQEAIPILEKAADLSNRSSGTLDALAFTYARAGRRKDALGVLAELKRRKQVGYVPAGSFVIAYMGLSDFEQAFAWLEQAYAERSSIMQWLKVHPLFDPIRNDPRFADLIRRVGLQ